ncbi:hypothetical protein BDW72DRAFT_173364 [Aspergillus terricola var. indicus]
MGDVESEVRVMQNARAEIPGLLFGLALVLMIRAIIGKTRLCQEQWHDPNLYLFAYSWFGRSILPLAALKICSMRASLMCSHIAHEDLSFLTENSRCFLSNGRRQA